MSVKENQRSRLSRRLLTEAMLDLMDEHGTTRISVTALCERAELNRSTFYAHYQDVSDLLYQIESDFLDRLFQAIDPKDSFTEKGLTSFFERVRRESRGFLTLLRVDPHFRQRLLDSTAALYLRAREPEARRNDFLQDPVMMSRLNFISAGGLYVIEKWIEEDSTIPACVLARQNMDISELIMNL